MTLHPRSKGTFLLSPFPLICSINIFLFLAPPPYSAILYSFSRCVTTTSWPLNRFQTNLFHGCVFSFLLILEDFRSLRRLPWKLLCGNLSSKLENICPGSFVNSSTSWSLGPKWETQLRQMFWTSGCLLGYKS